MRMRAVPLAGVAAVLLAACSTDPITISPTSTTLLPAPTGQVVVGPQSTPRGSPSAKPVNDGPRCAVHVADVRDVRLDPNDLGMAGQRYVQTVDSVAWLSGALSSMKNDPRLRFVDNDDDAEFTLRIELVKAYIMTITTQKSANVVLRANYSRNGTAIDTQIARGRDTGANWANGSEEVQGALNRALSAAVSELDNAIVTHCRSSRIANR